MSLADVLRGELTSWRGLDGSETSEVLARLLQPLRQARPAEERDRLSRRYTVVAFERATVPHLVESWFLVGEDRASLIEYDDPPVRDLDGMLQAFGAAEWTLTGKRYAAAALVHELVFASRGLTLSVAEPFDPTAGPRRAVHLQLYPASTVEHWVTRIGAGPEPHPFAPTPRS